MLESLLLPHALPNGAVAHRLNGLRQVPPGATVELADIPGPGCIRHLFMTLPPRNLRKLIIRFYWDDEPQPSIECPLPDFYGVGHDLPSADLRSSLFYVAPRYGYNCYIPMPFARRARITATNEADVACPALYVQIGINTYRKAPPPWRLHAAWRRVMPAIRRGAPLTLVEARGEGRLLGVIYHICKRDSDDRWSHGGGDHIYIDGDTAEPAYVHGMGGEDFAHHAWGLAPAHGPYTGAHMVHPIPDVKRAEGQQAFEPHGWEQHDSGRYSMFRYFIPDPIPFRSSLRMAFGTCANEISSTAYWYQSEPHTPFCTLPPPAQRAFGSRLKEEETWTPLDLGPDIPVAVLGPVKPGGDIWSPDRPVDLAGTLETDIRQPYGDTVRPPYTITWRRTGVRGGFIDLAAIHRPKANLRARGLWNHRHLPWPVMSYQLIRLQSPRARKLLLRLGFDDQLAVWHNGRRLAALHRPEPMLWATQDVPLSLKAGLNDIVLACTQERMAHWSAWGIYVKFLTPGGQIVNNLTFDSFATLSPTPERWQEPWPPEESFPVDDYRDPLYMV